MTRKTIFLSAYCVLLFACFTATGSQNSSLFSQFNKFELSGDALLHVRGTINDSALSPWFSNIKLPSQERYPIQFFTREQSLGVNIGAMLGLEQYVRSNRFGLISTNTAYRSAYLNAFISADVYSTERRITSPNQDIQFERFIKEDFNEPISGMFDFRVNLPEAYLETNLKFLTLAIGKQKMRWGPGYKGTLGLSGTAYSPFYYYNLNLRFGNLLRMHDLLCGYDDESIYRTELNITDTIRIKNNGVNLKTYLPRYGAGQRLDIRIGRHVQIGIYELVDFFGSNELTGSLIPCRFTIWQMSPAAPITQIFWAGWISM